MSHFHGTNPLCCFSNSFTLWLIKSGCLFFAVLLVNIKLLSTKVHTSVFFHIKRLLLKGKLQDFYFFLRLFDCQQCSETGNVQRHVWQPATKWSVLCLWNVSTGGVCLHWFVIDWFRIAVLKPWLHLIGWTLHLWPWNSWIKFLLCDNNVFLYIFKFKFSFSINNCSF